jgi:hypothetical protein
MIARQNFLCCGSCAGYDIATRVVEDIDKGKDPQAILGCVFYTRQDAAALSSRTAKTMYLAYGPLNTKKHGVIGRTEDEVGRIVCRALRESGIAYEWDGDPKKRIAICVADALQDALPKPAPVARLPRRTSPRQIASQLARQQATLDAAGDVLAKIAEVNDARA